MATVQGKRVNSRGWRVAKDGAEYKVNGRKKGGSHSSAPAIERINALVLAGHTIRFEPADLVGKEYADDAAFCFIDNGPGLVCKTVIQAFESAEEERMKI